MMIVLVLVLTLALLTILLWRPVKAYFGYRGQRLVTCPDNHAPAAVRVDAGQAALRALVPGDHLLQDCSRWPEKGDCGQECLCEVEAGGNGTRVSEIVAKWYEGKSCTLCGTPIDHLNWSDNRAALIDAEGVTRRWDSARPEELPGIFETNQPVCWSCHIAENFRRRYPDLVTQRAGSRS